MVGVASPKVAQRIFRLFEFSPNTILIAFLRALRVLRVFNPAATYRSAALLKELEQYLLGFIPVVGCRKESRILDGSLTCAVEG